MISGGSANAPVFLTRQQIDEAHRESLERHGGMAGLCSEHGIESALAAPINDYHYLDADLFAIAAAYTFHIAEAQAYVDGNKRTGLIAALVFLEGSGVPTVRVDTFPLYKDIVAIANRQMSKPDLAARFRSLFVPSGAAPA